MVCAMVYDSRIAECAVDVSIIACESAKGYYEEIADIVPDWSTVLGDIKPGDYIMLYSDCEAMFKYAPDFVVVREGGLCVFFYKMED